MLVPGGDYRDQKEASFLNSLGFDVAIFEHRSSGDTALEFLIRAFRSLKTKQAAHTRLGMVGLGSGGRLAAIAVQKMDSQPDDLVLISPAGLGDYLPGTVLPAAMPPVAPTARLLTMVSDEDSTSLIHSSSEYTKTWKGYDGVAIFRATSDFAGLLDSFLLSKPAIPDTSVNPATVPVAGYAIKRHEEKLDLISKKKFDLIMVGNSITNNFEKPEYQPVWQQFFAPRNALNLGYSGYRTENILWNIEHGELDGQSPKVVILEIGTNNVDEKNYPTRHTAGQLAGGITAIVKLLRQKVPDAKIIVLRCFPGCYGGPNPTSHRAILNRASDSVSHLADGQHIFYCDVNHVFLHLDGSINHTLMPDWLHPSPEGAKMWAQAMEPLLSQLMGDHSLDTNVSKNTAIVPVSKLEDDSYNWWDRHAAVLRIKDSINPEIVLIGNSITHFWGGYPLLTYADGKPREPAGPRSWASLFGPYRVLNLGFGWDRTQNVLWRLDHGELDGLHPRIVVINIGTNNTSQTANARMNTAPEILEGIRAVCERVRSKVPGATIILMAVFPREQNPLSARRLLITDIDRQLKAYADEHQLTFVDIGPRLLAPDGTFLPGMTNDYTHPTDKGYQIWADAIRPYITAP
jgi:lysophospholipase L1-like esterase